jgi:hypothetical protein
MTRLMIAATAGLIALSGAALGANADAVFQSNLRNVAPEVDTASLSPAQVEAIAEAFASSDSASEKRAYIVSISER